MWLCRLLAPATVAELQAIADQAGVRLPTTLVTLSPDALQAGLARVQSMTADSPPQDDADRHEE